MSTHRIILAPKILIYHFVSPSFKFTFKIIVVLCLRPAQSICCSFTIIMAKREPVGFIRQSSGYGSGDKEGPKFIRCVDGRQPEIHEVWNFGEDSVIPEVHLTACIDVGALVGECFAINYCSLTWHRIPMLGRNSINGSVELLGVPNFLRTDGPPWTLNILAPYDNLGDRVSSTIPNLGNASGGYSDGVSIN